MAGYSGTPLLQKLGIKSGYRVSTVNAPADFDKTLGPLPENAVFVSKAAKDVDVIVDFNKSAADFQKRLPSLADRIKPDGMVWIAWPKKASGVKSDLTEDVVRDVALPLGLVDIKVCAIDDTWSGLKLVIRKANRVARAK